MKLKIKVKNLIVLTLFTFFLILIIAPLVNLEVASYLNNKGSKNAEAFFKNYMNSPIRVNEKRGLYEYGRSLTRGFEKFQISFSGSGGGEANTSENMDKAVEIFESVLLKDKKTGYMDEYSAKAYNKLLDTSIAKLDMEKLLYWINWGRDKENKEIAKDSKLYEAYYYFVKKDYSKSKEILDDFDEENIEAKGYKLMGDVNLHLGDIDQAKKNYEKLKENNYSSGNNYFGGARLYAEEDVDKYIEKAQGDYKIKGQVSHNGKGLPFVEIYVSDRIGVLSFGGKMPDAITDENGYYESPLLRQGVYQLSLEIHPSQLDDKAFLKKDIWSLKVNKDIEFDFEFADPIEIITPREKVILKDGEEVKISWDRVKEADYYMVESLTSTNPMEISGGVFRVPLKDENGEEKIKNNSMNFITENLDKTIRSFQFEGDQGTINPTAILGSFIPEVDFPIIINAYDKKDNLVGTSLPLISDYEDLVSIEIAGELTKEEKLILEKKYEEVISIYEKRLVENTKDKDALFYLTRMYYLGWEKDKQDIPKALKYACLYDEENKDYNLALEAINYIQNGAIKDNASLVKKILEEMPQEKRNIDYYNIKARYYTVVGDFVKAKESYEKVAEDISINKVYIDILLEDYEGAIDTLRDEELSKMRINIKKMVDNLKNIGNITKEDKDLFKVLLKSKLSGKLSNAGEKTLYNKTLNLVVSIELKDIISEIGKEEYWDEEY